MKLDRREFLKNTAIAGAGAALAFSPLANIWANDSNKKTVRLAIIGTGGRGRYLLTHLLVQEITNAFEVTALCDNYQPSLDKAMEICSTHNIQPKTYTDYRDLIREAKVDGVIIATPLFQHAHITIDCLNAGIHVLCEKSMARTLEDVKAMYDAHINSGSLLLIGHQRLWSQKYLHAMDLIHQGEIGVIGQMKANWHRNHNWRRPVPEDQPHLERQINWRLYKEYSAGLLTELMSHQLQVANWAMQQRPVSVMGTGSIHYYKDGREVPDNVALIFSYADGTQFIYDSMTINKNEGCEEFILGDYGTMSLETNNYKAEVPPPAPAILQLVNNMERNLFKKIPIGGSSWAPELSAKYNGEEIYADQKGDGSLEELLAFMEYIRQGSAPEWMVTEAYHASIWTLLGEQAIDSGQKISCPEEFLLA